MLRKSLDRANELIHQMSRNELDNASANLLPVIRTHHELPESNQSQMSEEHVKTKVLNHVLDQISKDGKEMSQMSFKSTESVHH
jgi:hypothetical protein